MNDTGLRQKGFAHIFLLLALLAVVVFAGIRVYNYQQSTQPAEENVTSNTPLILVGIGDIVCDPSDPHVSGNDTSYCQSAKIHDLVASFRPSAVLGLGDLQYEDGAEKKFQSAFDSEWGDLKNNFYPAPGNHEYGTIGAQGYFKYFSTGQPSADISRGYYSFNLAEWHIISLNSNCSKIGGCEINSPQLQWLKQDLEQNKSACTLAFWHHPRFTSGKYAKDSSTHELSSTLWSLLADYNADVILNGHDHLYERFAPQTPAGQPSQDGIRQFTVGSGGRSLYKTTTPSSTSEKIIDDQFGILKLELYQKAYRWEFIAVDGNVLDSGRQNCIE